ncbi:MAG: acetylglutamate kinase [Thermodesulfobacteriota bacterium]
MTDEQSTAATEPPVVVKIGGAKAVDPAGAVGDVAHLVANGRRVVVVHGGGPQISKVLEQMGIASRFVRGMRLTDAPTMDVVEMVLGGKVNKSIVAQINRQGGRAVGLSGKDGRLIQAQKMHIVHQEDETKPPEIIDPGLVGEVTRVDPTVINTLTARGFIPIIAPVGTGESGETYNINADLVAGKIAQALSAGRFILLTDVDGVLDKEGELISSIDAATIQRMVEEGSISGGMIPKIEHALEALQNGVGKTHIINGKKRHALLLELFTDSGIGTQVTV